MKNKIVQFTLLGAFGLLLLVPAAMPFAKPGAAGLQVSPACNDLTLNEPPEYQETHSCSVQITGLAAGKSYQLEIVNNCTGVGLFMNISGNDSTGTIYINNNITPVPETDATHGCAITNWNFYLLTPSGRQLASGIALDE